MVQDITGGGKAPRLSIIIISYNTKEVTDNCIASIYSAKWRDKFEIIVVDNNSHDGTADIIKAKYPEVKLILNSDNKLFAKANNQGAKIAKGDYLLLLNSDTLVYDDNIQRMIDFYDTLHSNVICIGPKILNPDKSLQSKSHPRWGTICEHFFHLTHMVKVIPFLKLLYPTLPKNPDKIQRAGWVAGCAMMIRRLDYDRVGGLNEKIEFYGEEPEFGYRTSRLGYHTIYYPESEIIHLGGISSKKQDKLNPEAEAEKKLKSLNRYYKLVQQTCGINKAIKIANITIAAYSLLRIISTNKVYFTEAIDGEREVISFLRSKIAPNQPQQ